jgi:hypothetical protein
VEPPDFLDFEGTELLFIGATEDVSEELGLELETEDESEATAEIFNDLRLEKSEHPVEPLLNDAKQTPCLFPRLRKFE